MIIDIVFLYRRSVYQLFSDLYGSTAVAEVNDLNRVYLNLG